MVFALLGELILRVFSVSVPAFQIAGGIIVLLFSIQMVMGKKEKADAELTADPPIDIAIYPLGIPLMASVSGLVAIVSLLAQNDDLASILKLSAMIATIMAINYVSLRASGAIVRAVGPAPIEVVGKIMGVILAALAIELMLMGLSGLQLITLPPRGA
jgi:multiple antibiotic resistance protein